jgi:hypothetical protein
MSCDGTSVVDTPRGILDGFSEHEEMMPWNFPLRLSTTFGGGCVG